ncbi:hypothetical protein M407DRAFT_9649 [Tulasnella calospora MUT 4182]|uniref:Uncharacterized protein n=1 Tax=Tulasnella calospora MUT 4182 TaxID=1051891 RepID=A0A0C3LNR7_9AGAM|nr:hypothetical protein M407DRAFT_9649 [Tulasnella calospora MUT 4182]
MPSQAVYLPHLSSLSLRCGPSSDLLIRAMRFPQYSTLIASPIGLSDPDSDSSLTHVVDVIGNLINNSQTILHVSELGFRISSTGDNLTSVDVDFEGDPEVLLSWFIDTTATAISASPGLALILESNFSYDWTMRTISKPRQSRIVTALWFAGGRPVGDSCNPLGCLYKLGDEIQHYFPQLEKLEGWINSASELESLCQVILRRSKTLAGQGQSNVSPLQEVVIEYDSKWSLPDDCGAGLNMIEALVAGGNLKLHPRAS